MSKDLGAIFQQGYIVADVEQAAQEWVERVGAGPFMSWITSRWKITTTAAKSNALCLQT